MAPEPFPTRAPALIMNFRRLMYLGHRWLGIVLCLFMALWFLSGVVMMYVGYPKLTLAERLQSLPALDASLCCVPVDKALAALPPEVRVETLRLTSIGGIPHFVAGLGKGQFRAINAHNGHLVDKVDATAASAAAQAFSPGAKSAYVGIAEEDAWTHSKGLDGYRPLHRIDLAGDERAILYVSGVTGEVVRDVSVVEKYWNWLGAWLHWLYPLRGGIVDAWWRDFMIYTSLAATVLSLIGIVVGCWRWRSRPYAHGSRSPYRQNWMRWHHWLGLVFGVLTITWIASGLFSMNPWKMFDSGATRPLPQRLSVEDFANGSSPERALHCFQKAGFSPREMEWLTFSGEMFTLGRDGDGRTRLLRSGGACEIATTHSESAVQAEGERLMPHARLLVARIQTEYDWHYYGRASHTMSGHLEKPLPVLVLEFDDLQETWLYMDLRTGLVLQRLDSHARVKRWLFALLHSWDWKPLLDKRPLWDLLLVFASMGGFLLGITGTVIGWRRLVRRKPGFHKETGATAGKAL